MFSRIEFIITETMISLRRHPGMAFAAVACVMAALFVSGFVGLIFLNARELVNSAMQSVRFIVYFHPETTREEAQAAFERIKALNGIDAEGTKFVTKEDAWENMKKNEKQDLQLMGRNPLPDCVNVKPILIEDIPELKARIETFPEKQIIADEPNVSTFLLGVSKGIRQVGTLMGIVLLFLSLVIIHHSIELTIFARRKEIRIMSLVGATPLTIGMPFLLEGMIYGLLGGAAASGLLWALYQYLCHILQSQYQAHLLQDPVLYTNGALALLIFGIALGLLGSMGSVVKYLNRPKSKITNA